MAKREKKMGAVEIPAEDLPDDMPMDVPTFEPTGEDIIGTESIDDLLRDPPPQASDETSGEGVTPPPPVDAPAEPAPSGDHPELTAAIDLQGEQPSGEGMADGSAATSSKQGSSSGGKRSSKGKEPLTREQRLASAAFLAPLLSKAMALAVTAAGSTMTTDRFVAEKIAARPGWRGGAPFDIDFAKLGPGADLSEALISEYTVWQLPTGEVKIFAGRRPPADPGIQWKTLPASLEMAIAFNIADGPAQALDKAVEWIESHESTVRLVLAGALAAYYGMTVMRDRASPQVEVRPAPPRDEEPGA